MAEPRPARAPVVYLGMLAGFIGFFSLTLLTLLDVRRGVLFASYPLRTRRSVRGAWPRPRCFKSSHRRSETI